MPITVVIGRSGEGKSVYSFHRAVVSDYGLILVWDGSGNAMSRPGVGEVFDSLDKLQSRLQQYLDYPDDFTDPTVFIYRPNVEDLEGDFELFAVLIRKRLDLRSFALILDEGGTELQNAWKMGNQLRALLNEHRTQRRDVFFVINSHFLSDFAKATKGLMNELVMFRTTDYGTLDTAEKLGVPEDALAIIPELPIHHAVLYYFERHEPQWEILDDPTEWEEKIAADTTPERKPEPAAVDADPNPDDF